MSNSVKTMSAARVPWNKGKLIRQKPPLKISEIWTVGTQL